MDQYDEKAAEMLPCTCAVIKLPKTRSPHSSLCFASQRRQIAQALREAAGEREEMRKALEAITLNKSGDPAELVLIAGRALVRTGAKEKQDE